MNPILTPLKRSRELTPLSREHHHTLLFVWKIRQGIRYNISSSRLSAYCKWFWETNMKDHFKKEEYEFLNILDKDDKMLARMISEHQLLQEGFMQINETTSAAAFESFVQKINEHIRFEERELFDYIEKTVSKPQLEMLATHLNDHTVAHPVWEDEFWVNPL
jgi:hemerythrin-like domain-containing protein